MPRADTNFKKAVENAISDNRLCEMTIDNRIYLLNSAQEFEGGEGRKIGFTDSARNNLKLKNSRWIEPDAYFLYEDDDIERYIFVEQCGDWKNFYLKRFVYDQGRLSLYVKKRNIEPSIWGQDRPIKIDAVLFILRDDGFNCNCVNCGPLMSKEIYSFTYERWLGENCNLGKNFTVEGWFGNLYRRRDINCEMSQI